MNYLMEDPRESERLAAKVDAPTWVEKYLTPQMASVRDVLDVGCGPGILLAAAADRHAADFVGVDISPDRLAAAKERLADRANASVTESSAEDLPFADESFDLVYCRFLLEYLPDKLKAVREMARVLRPGGRLMLQDLDGQLCWHHPIDKSLSERITRVLEALESTGFDPYCGRKLFHLLTQTGLSEIQIELEPYHLFAGTIDPKNEDLWRLKLDIAMAAAERVLGDRAAADSLREDFMAHLRDPSTLTYSVLFTAVARKA